MVWPAGALFHHACLSRSGKYGDVCFLTESGQTVLLANSGFKALIIAERDNSFIVVNVLGDLFSDTFEMSDEMLEELADLFDFSEIP